MNAEQLLQHFERISEAPDAIKRLRRFILDLAVRGKLVEQDPSEEPAKELLKQIAAEKARLVKAGEIKAVKPCERRDSSNLKLPDGWLMVSLAEIVNRHLGGGTPSKSNLKYWDGPLLWASVKDVGKSKYLTTTIDRITVEGLENSSSNLIAPGNLLVVTRMGLGKVSINTVPVAINQDLRALFMSSLMDIDYCYNFFLTHGFEGSGLTVKGIKIEELLSISFPLPPLTEQHRIVAKVNELMSLCDQLEAAKAEREKCRDSLVAASLQGLNQPAEEEETFREHARFTFNNLPRITTRAVHIKQLRQTILNLAVRGKLVEQDPGDEPAAELLKRIAAEKDRLVKAGEIPRKQPAVRDLSRDIECLPESWELIALGEVCNMVTSGSRGWAEFYATTGAGFIRAQNIRFGQLKLDDLACVNLPQNSEGSRTKVEMGDLLMVITGAGVTNPATLDQDIGEAYVSQHVGLMRPTRKELSDWLLLCLMSPSGGRNELTERAYGAGKPGLNLDNLRSLTVPLPPLAEQHRIVAKVDELMAICDQLEAQITVTEQDSRRFLESVLADALAPGIDLSAEAQVA
jgi:type I restriction enzyme S subunit